MEDVRNYCDGMFSIIDMLHKYSCNNSILIHYCRLLIVKMPEGNAIAVSLRYYI